jgi:flagellar basal-body rod protein FlgG
MVRGLYVAASGISLQTKRNDVYAANLANVSTAGYRRSQATGQGFEIADDSGRQPEQNRTYLAGASGAPVDLSPGRLVQTGNDFHLAVQGRGLFCVQTPNGEAYTANGQFQLNNQNTLVTKNGHPVLGQQGPMRITGDFRVAEDGQVFDGDRPVDSLRIVEPADPAALQKLEGGLLLGGDPAPAADVRVVQGAHEGSNVRSMQELQRMMSGMRLYEANVRTLQIQDQTISTLLREAAG